MFKKIVAIFVMVSIIGCSTTNNQELSKSGMSMPEIMKTLANGANDITYGTFDPRGYPYTITNTYSAVGATSTSKTKSILMFEYTPKGFVALDIDGDPIVREIRTYEYEGGGWIHIATMVLGSAANAAMVAVFAGVGRPCRGCGGGSGGAIIYNHNEAGSFSEANVDSVTDVSVGCPTC